MSFEKNRNSNLRRVSWDRENSNEMVAIRALATNDLTPARLKCCARTCDGKATRVCVSSERARRRLHLPCMTATPVAHRRLTTRSPVSRCDAILRCSNHATTLTVSPPPSLPPSQPTTATKRDTHTHTRHSHSLTHSHTRVQARYIRTTIAANPLSLLLISNSKLSLPIAVVDLHPSTPPTTHYHNGTKGS